MTKLPPFIAKGAVERINALYNKPPRWRAKVGPHAQTFDTLEAAQGFVRLTRRKYDTGGLPSRIRKLYG